MGEPVNEYVADLRRLAKDCGFGDSLEKMLRDRLTCGINDQTIQQKMLVEKDLTFKRALEIAEGTQAADQNCREMRAVKVKEEPVNQVQDKPRGQNCHRCGYQGHLGNSCRHKKKICRNCHQKGHLARVCPKAPREQGPKKPRDRDRIKTQIETMTGGRHRESDIPKLRRSLTVRRLRRLATSGR